MPIDIDSNKIVESKK